MGGFLSRWLQGEVERECFGWVVCGGSVFVALMLHLNFGGDTNVFGLATYVWCWLAFLVLAGWLVLAEVSLRIAGVEQLQVCQFLVRRTCDEG